jgi:hypothetical protein
MPRASAALAPGECQALQAFTPVVRRVAHRTRGVLLFRVLENLQADYRGGTSTGVCKTAGGVQGGRRLAPAPTSL